MLLKNETQPNVHFRKNDDEESPQKSGIGVVSGVVRFFVLSVGIIFVWYILSFGIIGALLVFGGNAIQRGDGTNAGRLASISGFLIQQDKALVSTIATPMEILGSSHFLRGQERMLAFFEHMQKSEMGTSVLISEGRDAASRVFSVEQTTTASPALAVERMKQQVHLIQTSVGLADAEISVLLKEKPFPVQIPFVFTFLKNQQELLVSTRKSISSVAKLLALYPEIAGFKEKKVYLLLLQNSAEIRPTGGFIGSIALVTLDEGRLTDLTIQDVYTVDGQLKGHVDPPVPIRELMGQEHWYLRDSNWDPDFSVSGPKALWFYEKETGLTLDGVIGINSPFIVDILKATGPVQLPDYNDTITADNFYAKSLYYIHTDFFPGSTQKKDFLGSLLTALTTIVTGSSKTNSVSGFVTSVSKALDHGDIMFTFTDPQIQDLVGYFGWGGVLSYEHTCTGTEQSCLSDGVSIVDANIGINKVNYFITRKQEHTITIGDDGSITEEASGSYHNSSTSDDPAIGGGVYKNYSRWYLPVDANVLSVSSQGQNIPVVELQDMHTAQLPFALIDKSQPGWVIVSVVFTVYPTEDRRIVVSYERSKKLPSTGTITHLKFTNMMQPGIRNSEFNLAVHYPILWSISDGGSIGTPTLVAKEGRIQYNSQIAQSETIDIGFLK